MLIPALTAILGGVVAFALEYAHYLVTPHNFSLELWLIDNLIEVAAWVVLGIIVGWIVGTIMKPEKLDLFEEYKHPED